MQVLLIKKNTLFQVLIIAPSKNIIPPPLNGNLFITKSFSHEFYIIKCTNALEIKFWMIFLTHNREIYFYSVENEEKKIQYFLNIQGSARVPNLPSSLSTRFSMFFKVWQGSGCCVALGPSGWWWWFWSVCIRFSSTTPE